MAVRGEVGLEGLGGRDMTAPVYGGWLADFAFFFKLRGIIVSPGIALFIALQGMNSFSSRPLLTIFVYVYCFTEGTTVGSSATIH